MLSLPNILYIIESKNIQRFSLDPTHWSFFLFLSQLRAVKTSWDVCWRKPRSVTRQRLVKHTSHSHTHHTQPQTLPVLTALYPQQVWGSRVYVDLLHVLRLFPNSRRRTKSSRGIWKRPVVSCRGAYENTKTPCRGLKVLLMYFYLQPFSWYFYPKPFTTRNELQLIIFKLLLLFFCM